MEMFEPQWIHIPGTANAGPLAHGVMSGERAGMRPTHKALSYKDEAQGYVLNRLWCQFHDVNAD